ncbi:MAG: aminotransferase class V-fold PLP-dependent enzyme, partial [Pseudobdellovibrionaceae bacterium]
MTMQQQQIKNTHDLEAFDSPWREEFPSLKHEANGKPAVFLDTAASALKAQPVIDAINQALSGPYANIHRGLYSWSQDVTRAYEAAREAAARFVGGADQEIIFTRSTTESINLVAQTWGAQTLAKGDVVLLTGMEHHANIVPWQLLQEHIGFEIRVIPVTETGVLDLNAYENMLSPRVKLIGLVHISNALGTVNPVAQMIEMARKNAPLTKVLVDASQSVMHKPIHVRKIDADFLTITGHKLYGPTGIGYLWAKKEILASMRPWQGGGDMIETVTFTKTTYKDGPARFEAGTPAIIEVLGLHAALDFIEKAGFEAILAHEKKFLNLLISE